jgi:hypothetical protein
VVVVDSGKVDSGRMGGATLQDTEGKEGDRGGSTAWIMAVCQSIARDSEVRYAACAETKVLSSIFRLSPHSWTDCRSQN